MTPEQESDHLKNASHRELCEYLARKIRRERRLREESQEAFAKRAGISLRTFKRLEADGSANLGTFLKALIALEKSRNLQLLFPVPPSKTTGGSLETRIAALQEKRKYVGEAKPKS